MRYELCQCIEEHKGSGIRKHVRGQHGRDPSDVYSIKKGRMLQ